MALLVLGAVAFLALLAFAPDAAVKTLLAGVWAVMGLGVVYALGSGLWSML